jgi:hypothetical protein
MSVKLNQAYSQPSSFGSLAKPEQSLGLYNGLIHFHALLFAGQAGSQLFGNFLMSHLLYQSGQAEYW